MNQILCFGDSITLGESDIEAGGWVERLKCYYFAESKNQTCLQTLVYNLGVAGETTDAFLCRFETELRARAIKGKNTISILAFGLNDIVIHKNKNRVPESYFERNLTKAITTLQKHQAKVILLSLTPMATHLSGKENQHGQVRNCEDITRYNELIKKIAEQYACDYIDLFSVFEPKLDQLLTSDGFHPNANGHQMIYQMVMKKLNLSVVT